MSNPRLSFYQSSRRFSAAHRYIQKNWSEEQNRSEFGPCFNPHGHGHDYQLDVQICETLPHSAFELERALNELRKILDHQHLNHRIERFEKAEVVPTTENLAIYCAEKLKELAPELSFEKLRLFETSKLWVEIDFRDLSSVCARVDFKNLPNKQDITT